MAPWVPTNSILKPGTAQPHGSSRSQPIHCMANFKGSTHTLVLADLGPHRGYVGRIRGYLGGLGKVLRPEASALNP